MRWPTWLPRGREWLLFGLLLLAYCYVFPRYADWSQNSRLALIHAIVDEGRLEIDSYAETTGDYAEFRGHRYSDKAPGPVLLGVPVYVATKAILAAPPVEPLLDRLARGEALVATLKPGEAPRDKLTWGLVQIAVTWVVVALPAALLGVCLYRVLRRGLGLSDGIALLVTLSYGLATSAFAYAGNYYSHQLAAALLFGAFALVWKVRRPGPARLLVVGLLLGLALISEYPTALIGGPLGLYVIYRARDWRPAPWLALGALPPLGVLAAYNLAIFQTPLPVGYSYSTLWQDQHHTGFFSLVLPYPEALWGITFGGFRGLFHSAPILLLGLAGLVPFARRRADRAELLVCAWSIASFFAFNAASIMWFGGFAVGPRYLVPMLPFLALPIGLACRRWGDRAWFRTLYGLLLAWSLFAIWALSLGSQSFPQFEPDPLWQYSLPALAAGDVARNLGTLLGLRGLASLLPLAVGLSVLGAGLLGRPETPGAVAPSGRRAWARPGRLVRRA